MFKTQGGRQVLMTAAALAALAAPAVHAAPLPEGSTVTATLVSGTASGLLSLADLYSSSTNPAAAAVSSAVGDLEFLTDDAVLGFDWTADGRLLVWNNSGAALTTDYTISFSFEGHLAAITDLAGAGLWLSQSGDVVSLTVQAAAFTADFTPVAAVQVEVPEPSAWALAMTGLLAAGLTRRARR